MQEQLGETTCPLCKSVARVARWSVHCGRGNVSDRYVIRCTSPECHRWGRAWLSPERALAEWDADPKTTRETAALQHGDDVAGLGGVARGK